MIERCVALFAHLHVNRQAAPEMYRLPIQNGRLFEIN
jgi:insertion element IS1 protein InsB